MLLISRLIILITFLTIFALAQHQKEDDDDLWPQNYPGHLPTNISIPEGLNRIGSMEEDEDIDDYEELWPQNYPGHVPIPTNITWPPDNSTSEDGEEDKWDNRDNENEHQKGRHSHWWDWLFPWRKHYNRHGKGGHRNQTGNNSTVSLHKVIRISGGRIRGLVSHEAGIDKPALMFKGIPLAEPPVGELRFRPLRKKHPWKHELDATKYSPACLSNTTRTRSPQHYISEDCIYMNVFMDPKCLSGKPCPVLFYIHGGGFVYDSATMFNDTQIVQKYASDGIVFMVPAFRLGVFGYLDLGNDRAVKRNLGMHDIIFALEWAKREARAFGGDPKQITVMGNSAGGSAVAYLCTSPAVSKDHFQQAVISSGVPFFTNNTNLLPSYALLERFNCTGHSNQSSVRRSDRFKAECLRRVDALELLRQQEAIEEQEHLLFAGPETDAELLPARNYAALLKFWKARPLIYVTTKHEYEGPANNKEYTDKSAKLGQHCIQALVPFGLTTPQAFKHCEARYNDTFLTEVNMRVSYESMHAEAFLTALVNTRKSGQSYVGEFELTNYSNHANDMYFFIGLHPIIMNRTDVQLMDKYYPQMIKNFVRGKAPDPTWKPQNWNGRNYFRITYNVSENGTLSDWPHNVDGYQDLAGLNFWLREMPEVERNASKAAEKAGEEEQSWQYVFEPKEQGEDQNVLEKAQDLEPEQNQKNQNQNGVGRRFPILSALPPPLEMLDTPFDHNDTTISDTMDGTSTSTTESLETTGAGGILDGTTNVTTVSTPYTDELVDPTVADTSEATVIPRNESAGIGEIRKVWSAFWLTLTVAILLAIAVVIMAATKLIHRHENQHGGYSYNSGPVRDTSDFFFTEKSRIIGANDANSARYQ